MSRRHQRQAETVKSGTYHAGNPRNYWKGLVSLFLVLHLLAVVAEPFRFFTRSSRGTSPAADPMRLVLAPYVEFAYLNHGYFFFAPEPGPSHLIESHLDMPDGVPARLTFPHKEKQWPRLLYHRHFMLAEFLHQLHVPPVDPLLVSDDPQLRRQWQAERQVFEDVRDSMAQHLAAKYGAQAVRLYRLEHRLPSDEEVFQQRIPLDSPTLYVELPDAPLDVVPGETLPPRPAQGAATAASPLRNQTNSLNLRGPFAPVERSPSLEVVQP